MMENKLVINEALNANIKKFIYISTCSNYGLYYFKTMKQMKIIN